VHPLIVLVGVAVVGWLIDEERAAILRAADIEKARARRARCARAAVKRTAPAAAARLSAEAIARLIRALKDERRAAARGRDALPRGSPERQSAHEMVVDLTERIDTLYAQKSALIGGAHRAAEPNGRGRIW